MSAAYGLVSVAATVGLEAILVRPRRSIGGFTAQVTLSEAHTDDLEISDHPVELGAAASDHAYKLPAQLIIRCGWSNSPTASGLLRGAEAAINGTINGVQSILNGNSESQVKAIYQQLLKMQADRELLDVYTGKRFYNNMLVKSLVTETNQETENSLIVTVTLRQLIIVTTRTLTLPGSAPASDSKNLKAPEKNTLTSNGGAKQAKPAAYTGAR